MVGSDVIGCLRKAMFHVNDLLSPLPRTMVVTSGILALKYGPIITRILSVIDSFNKKESFVAGTAREELCP